MRGRDTINPVFVNIALVRNAAGAMVSPGQDVVVEAGETMSTRFAGFASLVLSLSAISPALAKPPELPSEALVEFKVPPQDSQLFYLPEKSPTSTQEPAPPRADEASNRTSRVSLMLLFGGTAATIRSEAKP
jgi:hypothetical protein